MTRVLRAQQEDRDVVAAYDFTGLRRVVDVGGGPAVLLAEILRTAPDLTGVLMDSESSVPRADGLGITEAVAG